MSLRLQTDEVEAPISSRIRYPDKIRRVIYLDKESKKEFIFLTNDQATSEDKKVLGHVRKRSPHSDLLCDHSLLYDAIVQKKMNIERSIYEILQIVSISLTDTTILRDLFAKPN